MNLYVWLNKGSTNRRVCSEHKEHIDWAFFFNIKHQIVNVFESKRTTDDNSNPKAKTKNTSIFRSILCYICSNSLYNPTAINKLNAMTHHFIRACSCIFFGGGVSLVGGPKDGVGFFSWIISKSSLLFLVSPKLPTPSLKSTLASNQWKGVKSLPLVLIRSSASAFISSAQIVCYCCHEHINVDHFW